MGKPKNSKDERRKTLVHEIRGLNLKTPKEKKQIVVPAQEEYDEDILLNVEQASIPKNFQAKQSTQKATDFFAAGDLQLDVFTDVDILDQELFIEQELQQVSNTPEAALQHLQPIFEQLAPIFHSYRAGALPRIMKALPQSSIWLQLLKVTQPEEWTPAACKEISRLFVAQLNDQQYFFYLNEILIPRARIDLQKGQKLSLQVFEALAKSTYRPNAFLKEVLEIVKLNDSSAFIRAICAIIKRCSFPRTCIVPFLEVICKHECNGASIAIIATILQKNYALADYNVMTLQQYIVNNIANQRNLVFYDFVLQFSLKYAQNLAAQQIADLYEVCKLNKQGGGIDDEILRTLKKQSVNCQQKQQFGFGQDDIVI